MYEISSFREASWTEPVILGGGGAGASGIEGYPSYTVSSRSAGERGTEGGAEADSCMYSKNASWLTAEQIWVTET